jgi:hypothetical protein
LNEVQVNSGWKTREQPGRVCEVLERRGIRKPEVVVGKVVILVRHPI